VQIIRTVAPLREALSVFRGAGERVALVPTMGALHAGHMALVAEARRRADRVVVSIFVNPKQFGAGEDLARYPRREATDARLLEQAGAAVLWAPGAEAMYPAGFATTVSVSGVSSDGEGAARPGHFDGVATVVAKLFGQVRPDVAVFGEKDWQQLAVVRRMAADLDMGLEVVGVPTEREDDGLALSSRNAYLDPAERQAARALPRALGEAADAIVRGQPVPQAIETARRRLAEARFGRIDYLALVDERTMAALDAPDEGARLIVAAMLGTTRLIDNLAVGAARS
jgi:pantoate--beta-alanine ligase